MLHLNIIFQNKKLMKNMICGHYIFPGNTEMMELIKKSQLNGPLPNANIVKIHHIVINLRILVH